MKKLSTLLLALLLLCSVCFAEAGGPFDVTLDPNYAEGAATTLTLEAATDAISNELSRYGYNFTGWYHDAEATTPVSADSPVTGACTLYAGWTEWTEEEKAGYDFYIEEMTYANDLDLYPTAFTPETFDPYDTLVTTIILEVDFNDYDICSDIVQEQLVELKALREGLEQTAETLDASVYYIWGEDMATYGEPGDYYLTYTNEGFRPFLVPYLVEDQSTVRGNVIVIAGGGYMMRCNLYEGYNIAEYYRDNGYNAFVLQRRIEPFSRTDAHLDLQRSVRYLRYHAEELGIAKTENMAAVGFSGGGMTITGTILDHYGEVSPADFDPDYAPDEIDQVNSDLQVALSIYGASGTLTETENPNIPAHFMAVGGLDSFAAGSVTFFNELQEMGIPAELHIFGGLGHGFGMANGESDPVKIATGEITGEPIKGADLWPEMSVDFMDYIFEYTVR